MKECERERGRTRDTMVVRDNCGRWGNMYLLSRNNRVVCPSLELSQTQLLAMQLPWF